MSLPTPAVSEAVAFGRWLPHYLVAGLLYGTYFFGIAIALATFTGVGATFWRFASATTALMLIMVLTRQRFPPRDLWGALFVTSMGLIGVPGILTTIAQNYIPSGLNAILGSMLPIMTLLMVLVVFRDEERITRDRVVGLITGFVGVLVVLGVWNLAGSGPLAGDAWVGYVLALCATLAPAFALPYVRRTLSDKVEPVPMAAAQVLCATAVMAPVALLVGSMKGPVFWQS